MSTVLSMKSEPCKEFEFSLDEIFREGALLMLVHSLNLEVGDYIESHKNEVNENGHRLVVRNGLGRSRKVTLGSEARSTSKRLVLTIVVKEKGFSRRSCRRTCVKVGRSNRCSQFCT